MTIDFFSKDQASEGRVITAGRDCVVIPVWNASAETIRCIESLDRHTPTEVPFIIIDDRGDDRAALERIVTHFSHAARTVVMVDMLENSGFAAGCNTSKDFTTGDIAVVNSDVVVGAEWFNRLRAAAHSSTVIATASTLTNYGTILSLPVRNVPELRIPKGMSVDVAAERVARHALLLRPRIPVAVGHCMYIKRVAFNLVGAFDESFGLGYGEEVDLSLRLSSIGMQHVCADDVYVFHKGSASFGSQSPLQARNERIINRRYPWYASLVEKVAADPFSPLAQAIRVAAQSLRGARVAIDARCLGQVWAGTQQATFHIISGLASQRPDVQLTVLVHSPAKEIRTALEAIPNVSVETATERPGEFDLVYRPYQINDLEELAWLRRTASTVAVSHLDLIAYHNASYHRTEAEWFDFRDLTRLTLSAVDGVTWISEFARSDAEANGFTFPGRPSKVVYLGTDPSEIVTSLDAQPPAPVPGDSVPFILQLGVAYHHKNREFAVKLLKALDERGWNGRVVFASNTPPFGSSHDVEASHLLDRPDLRERLIDLGEVTEAEKSWLVENASLAVYPSTSEGFGLNPFEFARAGLATLASRSASLEELIPPEVSHIESFDPETTAEKALELLGSEAKRQELIEDLLEIADRYSWATCAEITWEFLDEVMIGSRNRVHAYWGDRGVAEVFDHRPRTKSRGAATQLALIDSGIRAASKTPVKRFLLPEGSARQRAVRSSVNRIRRRKLG